MLSPISMPFTIIFCRENEVLNNRRGMELKRLRCFGAGAQWVSGTQPFLVDISAKWRGCGKCVWVWCAFNLFGKLRCQPQNVWAYLIHSFLPMLGYVLRRSYLSEWQDEKQLFWFPASNNQMRPKASIRHVPRILWNQGCSCNYIHLFV